MAMAVRDNIAMARLLLFTLPKYCRQRGLRLLAIFDQHNGLEPELRAKSPWSMPERNLPANSAWKYLGATVISASANNEYFLKVAVDAKWRRLDCFSGFTDTERAQWRRHHRFFDEGYENDWADVKALLDNWPLDMNDMREEPRETLAKTLEHHRDRRLRALSYAEDAHLRARVTRQDDQAAYPGIILDMLIGRGAVGTRYPSADRLINKHILYYCSEDNSVRQIHDLARQFYLIGGYLKRAGGIADSTVKEVLFSADTTADAKGRMLELYLAGCIDTMQTFELHARPIGPNGSLGDEVPVFSARALKTQYFPTQGVPPNLRWTDNMCFVPLNSNYPGADLLLWDATERLLVAVQVTVHRIKDHAMTFTPNLQDAWKRAAGAAELRIVWLAPEANVLAAHAGQYYMSLTSIQPNLAPLVAHYVPARRR